MGARRRRPGQRALGAVILGASMLLLGANGDSVGGSPSYVTFNAVAVADGARLATAEHRGITVVRELADPGAPVTQSVVTGLGRSEAFASFPYPGELAIAGPGAAAGLAGAPAPPDYPLVVSSSFGSDADEDSLEQPGLQMEAGSSQRWSEARAVAGGGDDEVAVTRSAATSASGVDSETGEVVATSTSAADGINIEGVLEIATVRAEARASTTGVGGRQRDSSFSVSGVTVGGEGARITEEGLVLGDEATPLLEENPLEETLREAGVSVRYLEPEETETGVVSAGLRVRIRGGNERVEPDVVMTFGRAMAFVSAVPGEEQPTEIAIGPDDFSGDAFEGSEQDSGGRSMQETASPPPPSPRPSGNAGSAGGVAPTSTRDRAEPQGPLAAEGPDSTEPEGQRLAATPVPSHQQPSLGAPYLALVFAAAVAVGGAQIIRVLGVKVR